MALGFWQLFVSRRAVAVTYAQLAGHAWELRVRDLATDVEAAEAGGRRVALPVDCRHVAVWTRYPTAEEIALLSSDPAGAPNFAGCESYWSRVEIQVGAPPPLTERERVDVARRVSQQFADAVLDLVDGQADWADAVDARALDLIEDYLGVRETLACLNDEQLLIANLAAEAERARRRHTTAVARCEADDVVERAAAAYTAARTDLENAQERRDQIGARVAELLLAHDLRSPRRTRVAQLDDIAHPPALRDRVMELWPRFWPQALLLALPDHGPAVLRAERERRRRLALLELCLSRVDLAAAGLFAPYPG